VTQIDAVEAVRERFQLLKKYRADIAFMLLVLVPLVLAAFVEVKVVSLFF
jgi:hypothetical protein